MSNSVLVVDDDDAILDLLSALLESEGYQVTTFDSATAALKSAKSQHPDVAVVDLMMPGMTGEDLIEALRADPRTNGIPVVVCSAYYGDLRRCSSKLGNRNIAYLRKPFHIDDLLDMVAEFALAAGSQPESEGARPLRNTGTAPRAAVC